MDPLLNAADLPAFPRGAQGLVGRDSVRCEFETAATQTPLWLPHIRSGSGLTGVVVLVATLANLGVASIGFLWDRLKRLKARLSNLSFERDDKPLCKQ